MLAYVRLAVFSGKITILFLLALLLLSHVPPSYLPAAFAAAALVLALAVFADTYWPKRFDVSTKLETWMLSASGELEKRFLVMSPRSIKAGIFVVAGLSLFLELALIRWEAEHFPVFGMYKNFTLLACFCGIGLGYAMAKDARLLLPATLPVLAFLVISILLFRYGMSPAALNVLQVVPVREEASVFFSLRGIDASTQFVLTLPVYILLTLVFFLNALVLLPIGQLCGFFMQKIPALPGYGCNLLGSLAGVCLSFVLSWLWAGPSIWFCLVVAALAFYQVDIASLRRVVLAGLTVCVIALNWPADPLMHSLYSPYQFIQATTQRNGLLQILAAGKYYQKVYDFSQRDAADEPANKKLSQVFGYYELPFKAAPSLRKVAIVGAGTGNDVAAALRNGAESVDAVELDPAIYRLGLAHHPERPYQDARVRAVINDARNFFQGTTDRYDAVVYGVLDSHVVLSHGGNVRTDSFVYTQEGLRKAYDLLKPGGMLSVSFALPNKLMGEKIFRILQSFPDKGTLAAILTGYDSNDTTTFILTKEKTIPLPEMFMAKHDLKNVTAAYEETLSQTLDLPSDNWPFFYMDSRMYPVTYLAALGLIVWLSYFLVQKLLAKQKFDVSLLPFFFLGAGFMLVETKAITELGLVFGNTWQVTGIAIVGVLVMALLANILVAMRGTTGLRLPFLGVISTIVLGYAVASQGLLVSSSALAKTVQVVLLVSPLFFSGMIFSRFLTQTKNVPGAMAYNLMGAMLGGVLEYNAMRFGFSSLYIIALVLYMAPLVLLKKRSA